MSCKKWEESIYLYDELSAEERRRVDDHLQQCEDCQILFQSLQPLKIVVKQVASDKPQIQHPELLTNRIMHSLPISDSSTKQISIISKLIDSVFTRYALAACSLIMIISFAMEQQAGNKISNSKPMVAISIPDTKVILHSNEFLETVKKIIKEESRKQKQTSVAELYACAKTNDCNYAIVKYFKQKQQHENL